MSEAVSGTAKFLVLHFLNGKLTATKVAHSWLGAKMSKQSHERACKRYGYSVDACTRILPMDAVLAIQGLERQDTELNPADIAILKRMGISVKIL